MIITFGNVGITETSLKSLLLQNKIVREILEFIAFLDSDIRHSIKSLWSVNKNIEQYVLCAMTLDKINYEEAEHFLSMQKRSAPECPVTPTDLIALGLSGKDIGVEMDKIKNRWIDSEFTSSRHELLAYIKYKN
jgi:poly(A) polymerase